jgi:hypothetical protein
LVVDSGTFAGSADAITTGGGAETLFGGASAGSAVAVTLGVATTDTDVDVPGVA